MLHLTTHLKPDADAAQLCTKCLSSSPLQNMAGGGATVVVAANSDHVSPCEREAAEPRPERGFTGFRSRAPPVIS